MHSTWLNIVKPHRGQFLNSADRHKERACEGSRPLRIFNLHGFLVVLLEIYRCLSAFLKVDPNGAYALAEITRIYEVFSILVWMGLVLGTETRKKTSPIQVNLEFPLASVSRNTVPARGKRGFGLNSVHRKAEVPQKRAPSGGKRIYIYFLSGVKGQTACPLESRKAGRLACCGLCGFARLLTIAMWGYNS